MGGDIPDAIFARVAGGTTGTNQPCRLILVDIGMRGVSDIDREVNFTLFVEGASRIRPTGFDECNLSGLTGLTSTDVAKLIDHTPYDETPGDEVSP